MDQYIGEIRLFPGDYAPNGWALCNGQLLPIAENEALYSLIGTTYGGDGQTTFALPNIMGRVVVGQGQSNKGTVYNMGQIGGTEKVTLTELNLPKHSHVANASSLGGTTNDPTNAVWAKQSMQYSESIPNDLMNTGFISQVGGNQPHENMMPYLTISYIISLIGIYPSQT